MKPTFIRIAACELALGMDALPAVCKSTAAPAIAMFMACLQVTCVLSATAVAAVRGKSAIF